MNKTTQIDIKKHQIKAGDFICFGKYDWLVLRVADDVLIISKDIIEQRPYHHADFTITWENCDLRKYLNNEFYSSFNEQEREYILQVRNENPNNYWYGTNGGSDTDDYIFLLSLEDTDNYWGNSGDYVAKRRKRRDNDNSYPDNNGTVISNKYDAMRRAKCESDWYWWWLRSPGRDDISAAHIGRSGRIGVVGSGVYGCSGGVRPALKLKLQYFAKTEVIK